jgi:hypothetical protein
LVIIPLHRDDQPLRHKIYLSLVASRRTAPYDLCTEHLDGRRSQHGCALMFKTKV